MTEPARPPFPFIVGCGRSGTTLLRAMVDSHPDMAVPPESHFVVDLAAEKSFDPQSFLDRLSANDRFALWELDRRTIEDHMERSAPTSCVDAIRIVFAAYAAARGKTRWADKTPGYVLHIRRLADLFPEAVVIHLIRDGRDVAASFLELGWAGTIEDAALHWRLRVRRGRRAGAALPSGRYHELRYEELVADPERSMRRFCDAASLAFDPALLDHHQRAAEVVRTTSHPSYHRHVAEPLSVDVRDWRRDLDDEDVARFELVAGGLLTELGYERSSHRPATRVRVDVARRQARWYAHRVVRKVTQQPNTTHKGVL